MVRTGSLIALGAVGLLFGYVGGFKKIAPAIENAKDIKARIDARKKASEDMDTKDDNMKKKEGKDIGGVNKASKNRRES